MARGWLGVIILVAFLIGGMVAAYGMSSAHMPTAELLQQASEKTVNGEFPEAVLLGLQAKDRWEAQWNGTASLADHGPMDEVRCSGRWRCMPSPGKSPILRPAAQSWQSGSKRWPRLTNSAGGMCYDDPWASCVMPLAKISTARIASSWALPAEPTSTKRVPGDRS